MHRASDLRKGLKVLIDGAPWELVQVEFCKPGKGQALYRCKLKNILTGISMDRTYRPNDRLEKPEIEERDCIFSYIDDDQYVFSDNESYEEIRIDAELLGDKHYFLIENSDCRILLFNGKAVNLTLPIFIEKRIAHTEPGSRGDTATNVNKPATLDNGFELQVPIFVDTGDRIKIDTRTGNYVERLEKNDED